MQITFTFEPALWQAAYCAVSWSEAFSAIDTDRKPRARLAKVSGRYASAEKRPSNMKNFRNALVKPPMRTLIVPASVKNLVVSAHQLGVGMASTPSETLSFQANGRD